MVTVLIGIGVPGSGKTTALRQIAAEQGHEYICPDDIREELLGDAADQSQNSRIWAEAYRRIARHVAAGRNVVIDATNATPVDRRKLTAHCGAGKNEIIGLWFRTPLEVCLERNANRDRTVKPAAIERMYHQLENNPPRLSDGFSKLMQVS